MTTLPAWQHCSESRSFKRRSMSCDAFDVFAALNTLVECYSPFWQIDPNYLVHKKKTCCLSLCRWLIGSSLGRDPFRDCGMNFSARRRHAGPNVNPYHCAYTAECHPFHPSLPPFSSSTIHTCNATSNPIVTHGGAAGAICCGHYRWAVSLDH